MVQENKGYEQIVKEIKIDLQKMMTQEIALPEAIELFEVNLKKIKVLKKQLTDYKMKVKKILENNKIEDFEV